MKAKIKQQLCQVPNCNQKAVGAWQPKHRPDKKLWVCRRHRNEADLLFKFVGVRKPERVHRPKPVIKNHKPKKEGKPAWQKILDGWFAKGKYPVGNFMNPKRWAYWISIGGKKPQGDSRKFDESIAKKALAKFNTVVHPLLTHKMNKHKKVRRKKDY